MKAREIIKAIKQRGGAVLRQNGSHVRVVCACGQHHSTVPDHGARDVPKGTLKAIERDLEDCGNFGKGWL